MKHLFTTNIINVAFILLMIGAGLISTYSTARAQENPWTQKAEMPEGTHNHAAVTIDDKIFIVGGRSTVNWLCEYDPSADTWTTKAPMPTSRTLATACHVNGKIYAIGGLHGAYQPAMSIVEQYDTATNTWTAKTPMPTPRFAPGSVVDGKIYVIGGMTSGPAYWVGMRDTVEIYDPLTDSWSIGESMPTERTWFTTSVVDGKIYAIGGIQGAYQPALSIVEEYDPVTDSWTAKSPMPTGRAGHAAAVLDGIIYIIGGGPFTSGYSIVEAYDPATDVWAKKADIPAARAYASADTIGGEIYVFGGIHTFAEPNLPGEKTVYVYDPAVDLTELIDNCTVNKWFAEAGNDSVCITTTVNDPSGITLYAAIESSDQTTIDSIELFDDGNHNDEIAGDSIYANVWKVNPVEERQYYIDVRVTRIGSDTVTHRMNNMATFTTIGPVVFEDYIFNSGDSVPSPGDTLNINLILKNQGSTGTATNIKAKITSADEFVTVTTQVYRTVGDIDPGQSEESSYFQIEIAENCPDNHEIKFDVEIASNDYPFWNDTFLLPVHSATGIKTQNSILQQVSNYPNPFTTNTTIQFELLRPADVTLKVYDYLGRELLTPVDEYASAGKHSVNLDASSFSSGVYLYRICVDDSVESRRMLIVR